MRFVVLTILFALLGVPALAHGQPDLSPVSQEASVSGQPDGAIAMRSALHHPPVGNLPAPAGEHCPDEFCSPPSPAALDNGAGLHRKPVGPLAENGAPGNLQPVHLPFDPPPPRHLQT